MTRGLTDKQERILNYIVEYVEDKGYPPSIREIGTAFEISSLRGVTVHLDALERKGYIKRANTSRSITVIGKTGATSPKRNITFLPIVGTIAAGTPITASENLDGHMPVSQEMVHNVQGAFVLRVKGDSMIDDHIMPSDFVIIKPQAHADNGELVAVMLGDEATVKRLQHQNGRVLLMPANSAYEPIEVNREDSRVIGKVIGLMRSYN
jgi:repressor LexA